MTTLIPIALSLLLQSTALLLLGLLALRLTRQLGPAVQTLIGRATLTSVALLLLLAPLTGHVQTLWRVTLEPTPSRSSPTLPRGEGEEVGALLAAPSDLAAPSSPQYGLRGETETSPSPSSRGEEDKTASQQDATIGTGTASSTLTAHVLNSSPSPLGRGAEERGGVGSVEVGSYAAVTLTLLLWLAVCQWHLTRLRRTATPLTSGPAADLLTELTPHPPQLLTHPDVRSPFLAGLVRPAIFLPPTYAADFDPDALRAILAHELAHFQRRDNAWTLAARLLCALLWPQPLLWLLCRQLEQIAEDACDAVVLAQHCPPRAYADCLLTLAERHPLPHRQRALGAGVTPYRSALGRRVQRILTQGKQTMSPVSTKLRLTIAALTLAAVLGGVCLVSSAPAQVANPALTSQEQQYLAAQKQDLQNLRQLGLGVAQYVSDNDGIYPDANHWMDQISPYFNHDEKAFYDPFQPGQHYGYAFNRNCSKKLQAALRRPAQTVIVFDSTLGKRNASDTGTSLRINQPPSSRLHAGSGYGFGDIHPKWFTEGVQPSFLLKGGEPIGRYSYSPTQDQKIKYFVKLPPIAPPVVESLAKSYAELSQAQFLAGLTAVQGPGVIVTLRDSKQPYPTAMPAGMAPPNLIHDTDINQVINELRAAGAEAISVNGQRLVATSPVRTAGTTIFINNVTQTSPYTIKAIGNPATLHSGLTFAGGIASQIRSFDKAMFDVQESKSLTLPAYTEKSEPRYARPVSEAAKANPINVRDLHPLTSPVNQVKKQLDNQQLHRQQKDLQLHLITDMAKEETLQAHLKVMNARLSALKFSLQATPNATKDQTKLLDQEIAVLIAKIARMETTENLVPSHPEVIGAKAQLQALETARTAARVKGRQDNAEAVREYIQGEVNAVDEIASSKSRMAEANRRIMQEQVALEALTKRMQNAN